jgi:hypothetical protein
MRRNIAARRPRAKKTGRPANDYLPRTECGIVVKPSNQSSQYFKD